MPDRNLFSFTVPELQRWHSGQVPSARHLNQVVDAVDDILTGIASPRQVSHPPRGAAKEEEAGTRTRFCTIVSSQSLEEPTDILDHQSLVAIQFVTGADSAPTDDSPKLAWTWPARTYKHYKMFVGKSDVFLALYMEGGWYVRWDMRFMPVPVPENIVTGDCSV